MINSVRAQPVKVTSISGHRGDERITRLFPTGKWIPGNVGYPVDNLLSAKHGAQLTILGLAYSLASGVDVNIYYKSAGTHRGYGEIRTTTSSLKETPIKFEAVTLEAIKRLPKLRAKARGCHQPPRSL